MNAGTTGHDHTWSMLAFELVDGRPSVRQRCDECGQARHYRAWERYWDPDAPPGPGLTEPGSTARHPSPAVIVSSAPAGAGVASPARNPAARS